MAIMFALHRHFLTAHHVKPLTRGVSTSPQRYPLQHPLVFYLDQYCPTTNEGATLLCMLPSFLSTAFLRRYPSSWIFISHPSSIESHYDLGLFLILCRLRCGDRKSKRLNY